MRWCVIAAMGLAGASHAQQALPPAVATAQPASGGKSVCVDAEVNGQRATGNGQRALPYDCLSTQLQPKAAAANGASPSAAEAAANQSSNRVGTFNLSTEQNLFGSNWDKSATPQRPALPVAVPPK